MSKSQLFDSNGIYHFISKEWNKVLPYLKKRFEIGEEDCKDIFQESVIILYNNIQLGKLNNLSSSLSTYFISICKNKALEFIKKNSKYTHLETERSFDLIDGEIESDKIEALLALDDGDAVIQEQKEALVREIVKDLPSPCNELLWGFYRDELSMKTLAEMYNYKSESSVKVTKYRCCEKFRARYNELCNKIF